MRDNILHVGIAGLPRQLISHRLLFSPSNTLDEFLVRTCRWVGGILDEICIARLVVVRHDEGSVKGERGLL